MNGQDASQNDHGGAMSSTQAEPLDLNRLRQEIDEVDLELVRLIDRRMRIVDRVGLQKLCTGAPVVDPKREAAVLGNANEEAARLGGTVSRQDIEEILGAVIQASRRRQKRRSS